jgi:translation elongation factor P/translation initiation factor 5A
MEEKEPNKNKKKKGANMKKGTRDTFDQREKDMFWNILRTRNAGKIWKILTESSSNQARHDAWVIVAQTFSGAISKDFTPDQAKQLFKRIKEKKKKDHDSQAVEREFRKHCSATGGGPSSMPPPERDGDDFDENLNEMDPVNTYYNSLIRPEHRIYASSGSSASARRPLGEIHIQNSEILPNFSERTVETTSMEARSSPPTPSITPPPAVSPFSRNQNLPGVRCLGFRNPLNNNESLASASAFTSPAPGTHQVLIQDGNGVTRTVDAEEPVETPKLPKRKVKKTMNDAAVFYYTNMSDVQTSLAKQRMRVLKRKENVETLRQMLLERALQKEGVDIPDFGNIDSSESDTDEDIETDV